MYYPKVSSNMKNQVSGSRKKIQMHKSNLDLNPSSKTFSYCVSLSEPSFHHLYVKNGDSNSTGGTETAAKEAQKSEITAKKKAGLADLTAEPVSLYYIQFTRAFYSPHG